MNDEFIKEFREVKARYAELRAMEKDRITRALVEHGYTIMNMSFTKPLSNQLDKKAGRGLTKYTGGGKYKDHPYDLSNWMWINFEYKKFQLCISLNAFDIDPNTGNGHVMFDRLSVWGAKKGHEEGIEVVTDYDLPLSDEELEEFMDGLKDFIKQI